MQPPRMAKSIGDSTGISGGTTFREEAGMVFVSEDLSGLFPEGQTAAPCDPVES